MQISYDNLFAYFYKNNISRSEIANKAGISRNSLIKMSRGEAVHLNILFSICDAYDLEFGEYITIKK